jgi:hypothetical protein
MKKHPASVSRDARSPWSSPELMYSSAPGFQTLILLKELTPPCVQPTIGAGSSCTLTLDIDCDTYGCNLALVYAVSSRDLNIQLLSVQVSKLTVENHNGKI